MSALEQVVVGEPRENFLYDVTLDRGRTLTKLLAKHYPEPTDPKRPFLDVGGRDGRLKYLLGMSEGRYDANRYKKLRRWFGERFDYYGCDLIPQSENVLAGDICRDDYLDDKPGYVNFFEVIYSNNVFEHLARPWVTVKHIDRMLRPGGLVITVAPWAHRYHKAPDDYFRYSHSAMQSLFSTETDMKFDVLVSGYDLYQRRWNIFGVTHSAIPADQMGGWRENWMMVSVLRKKA
jgi:SAM-dependent methyltransferase